MSLRDPVEMLLNAQNRSELSRRTEIPRATLARWQEHPENTPVWAVRVLAKAQGYKVEIKSPERTYTL